MDPRIQRDTATSGTLVLRENPDADVPGCNADDEGENDRGLTATDTKTRSLKPGTACQIEFRLIHFIGPMATVISALPSRPSHILGIFRMLSFTRTWQRHFEEQLTGAISRRAPWATVASRC